VIDRSERAMRNFSRPELSLADARSRWNHGILDDTDHAIADGVHVGLFGFYGLGVANDHI
jgi:hypothetical protein